MLEAGLRGTSIDWDLDERAFDLTKSAGFASLCFAILGFVKCISEKTKKINTYGKLESQNDTPHCVFWDMMLFVFLPYLWKWLPAKRKMLQRYRINLGWPATRSCAANLDPLWYWLLIAALYPGWFLAKHSEIEAWEDSEGTIHMVRKFSWKNIWYTPCCSIRATDLTKGILSICRLKKHRADIHEILFI